MAVLEGILPSTKSRLLRWDDIRLSFLIGHLNSLSGCGVWMSRGCLDHDKHGQQTLDGVDVGGKDVVEFYKASCHRLGCPICYEKACGYLAIKSEHRMLQFKIRGRKIKALHVVVSPSEKDVTDLSLVDLRKKAYRMAMACGLIGGTIIFHHLRKHEEDDFKEDLDVGFSHAKNISPWYLSPHFHIVGYGWIRGDYVKQNYEDSGWIVKNLGVRKSIRSTIHYQLSHCFIAKGWHTVVWFGALAYNKLKCSPLVEEEHLCPLCNSPFVKVRFVHSEDAAIVLSSLEDEGIYYVPHGIFKYVDGVRRFEGG